MIDQYLRSQAELDDRAVHLLFSANRWELAYVRSPSICTNQLESAGRPRIRALLAAGTTVLCDRYAFSGAAFTAAKPNAPPRAWCRSPDAGLLAPDLTLLFDVSPEVARARGGYGEERYEKEEMQKNVRVEFGVIGEKVKEEGWRWIVVDAGRTVEEVEAEVRELVGPLLGGIETPVGTLWNDEIQ